MNIVLTYDPRWGYTPESQSPYWASLDTVDYVVELLEDCGCRVIPCSADNNLETSLQQILSKHPRSIVFWLNEFMQEDSGKEIFTVKVIEDAGFIHTGPCSDSLALGLDKEKTKSIFRKIGLPTPKSIVVTPGDNSQINKIIHWNRNVLIKPLLQGNSRGIDEFSIVESADIESIKNKVDQIHKLFNEPALIECYIGGNDAKEFSIPMLISYDERVGELPIVEIDLSKIPSVLGRYKYLTREIKIKGHYQKNKAEISRELKNELFAGVRRIIKEIGCRDMTRVDLRSDSTGYYFIEVNVNPCKTKLNSSLMMSAYSDGLKFSELIAWIPYQAMMRNDLEPPRKLEELTRPVMTLFDQNHIVEHHHSQFEAQEA